MLKYFLGYPDVRNYNGSWTEWGNPVRTPIEKPREHRVPLGLTRGILPLVALSVLRRGAAGSAQVQYIPARASLYPIEATFPFGAEWAEPPRTA